MQGQFNMRQFAAAEDLLRNLQRSIRIGEGNYSFIPSFKEKHDQTSEQIKNQSNLEYKIRYKPTG